MSSLHVFDHRIELCIQRTIAHQHKIVGRNGLIPYTGHCLLQVLCFLLVVNTHQSRVTVIHTFHRRSFSPNSPLKAAVSLGNQIPKTTRNALEKYLILRSDFVHTTFSYWPALQPAPIYKFNCTGSRRRYSPNRTGKSWNLFLRHPCALQEPSSSPWKSTYPCPASYCLKLSTFFLPSH